ncbi:YlbG family protein [Loigolactobacillus backii]|uniref:UPF0298 protein AYR53_10260 n=1 Tax=Loigolactobacillus backii TaxID=375175 RepID=A0A192H415_9LACO|nr:YlbG family protein [Loigolactobacillus backii]ANK59707.1 cytosolic protein [Loigolactobacillus backii]ANK63110.1 cytosolic protein [Loigolactobacillus backii]ANK64703.1 cytosolic protein [Loigolactobacillus backii]ANK66848.1 cytosolic protein [Loigolactobacillus backii]ANK69882.1 cytosolic protein [Loigolactobacillus backii]
MAFEVTPRQGIVVWLYSMKQIKQLRRFGIIYYSSRKMKYVYLYVDQAIAEQTLQQLKKLHFVKRAEVSHRPELDMNFGDRVGKLDDFETSNRETNETRVLLTTQDLRKENKI